MLNIKRFLTAIGLVPVSTTGIDAKGEMEVLDSNGKLNYSNGTTASPVVTESHASVLTNKTLDADLNTITNIDNADIKAAAAIDATKLADGSVSNIELQYINSLTSNAQTQITAAASSGSTAQATIDGHIADATAAHAASAVSNAPVGNLAATDVQGALNELQGDIDTNTSGLSAHIADAVGAHSGSAISNTPAGNLLATDVQGALNELQGDIDTNTSGLSAHISDTIDAHAASAIGFTPVGTIAATTAQAAIAEVATDAASALSSHEADSTAVHGIADTAALVTLTGTQTLTNKTLTSPAITTPTGIVKGDVGLGNVDNVSDANKPVSTATQTALNLKANLASPALTGTPTAPTATAGTNTTQVATTEFVTTAVAAGGGGGGGVGDLDTVYSLDFDSAVVGDFPGNIGLALVTTNPIHGAKSAQMIHDSVATRYFGLNIDIDRKFRGKNVTLSLSNRSTATDGNVTLYVQDNNGAVVLVNSESIQTDSTTVSATTTNLSTTLSALSTTDINIIRAGMSITGTGIPSGTVVSSVNVAALTATLSQAATASGTATLRVSGIPTRREFTFNLADTTTQINYLITCLTQSGSPETYIDDIVIELTERATQDASVTLTTNAGQIVGSAYSELYDDFTLTTAIPYDDTIPQISEGTQVFSLSYTPKRAGNKIRVNVHLTAMEPTNTGDAFIGALFQNGGADAIAAGMDIPTAVGGTLWSGNIDISKEISAASTSPITFTVRAGNNSGAATLNRNVIGTGAGADLGGKIGSSITVEEIQVGDYEEVQSFPTTSSVLVTEPDSYLKMSISNGYGSTNTAVRRYTNVTQAVGTGVRYVDSATLGGSFEILEDGEYSIDATENSSTDGASSQITKNSTTLTSTTGVEAERLSDVRKSGTLDQSWQMSWTGPLKVGDIIRVQQTTTATAPNQVKFSISKNGKMKQLNPSSDQKIEIPTHEVRFEGATSRGATNTAIVKYNTQARTVGAGFSVVNTTANGTEVTVQKDGILTASATMLFNTQLNFWLTRNQAVLTAVPAIASEILAANVVTAGFTDNISWSGPVKAGDVIRVSASGTPGDSINNNLNLVLQETKVQVALSNVVPQFEDADGYLELNTANGTGSTYNKVLRFSNLARQDAAGKFTYTDSATDGMSVTVNESGLYYFSASHGNTNNVGCGIAITKNENLAVSGSIDTLSMTVAQGRISVSYVGAFSTGLSVPVTTCYVYLTKGDVIRVKVQVASSPDASWSYFSAAKVSQPSIAAVDVTPFVNLKGQEFDAFEAVYNTGGGFGSTNTGVPIYTARSWTNKGIIRFDSSATLGSSFTALKDCRMLISASGAGNGTGTPNLYITKNSAALTATTQTGSTILARSNVSANNLSVNVSANVDLVAGDVVRVQRDSTNLAETASLSIVATADANNVVSAAKTYRMSDLLANGTRVTGTAPTALGQYRTYLRNANAATFTEVSAAPTASPSTTNGMRIYSGNAYTAADTASSPTFYEIFIGKNKVYEIDWYNTTGRTGYACADVLFTPGTPNVDLGYNTSYDPTTGILAIYASRLSQSTAIHVGAVTPSGSVTAPYFDITVFDSPFVSATFKRRVATIKEEFPSGTNSGTSTAGVFVTRNLNTLVDPTGIVTSLASGAFVLPAGTYRIRGSAPALTPNNHRIKLRNVTDSVDIMQGTVEYSSAAAVVQTRSHVEGIFTLTSAKSLSILHRVATARANDGYGTSDAQGTEVYTTVEIEKLD